MSKLSLLFEELTTLALGGYLSLYCQATAFQYYADNNQSYATQYGLLGLGFATITGMGLVTNLVKY